MPRYKWNSVALIAVLLLQGIITILLISSNKWWNLVPEKVNISHKLPLPKAKVHVLLLSSWRSGSSFLGQVFSQHPNVFYLMEPGWHVWSTLNWPGALALQVPVRDLLRNVFQCDLSSFEAYTPAKRNVSHLFMWSQSRALCSPPACSLNPHGPFHSSTDCARHCDTFGFKRAQEACRSYSHVALKEVRLFDLQPLYPLLHDPTLDLRIIHLVRDPRAVVQSRLQAGAFLRRDDTLVLEMGNARSPDAIFRVVQEVCRGQVRIHKMASLQPYSNRYRLVRYEDMVRDPLKEIENLYKFTGLQMTSYLKDWIHHVTHGKSQKGPIFQVSSRNAAMVSEAWRVKLPYSKVRRIQDVCSAAMSLLGYLPVSSDTQQRDLKMDLLSPRKLKHSSDPDSGNKSLNQIW
ncbi:carbohydrate sulfotransferase 6-like isoform X2 [Paramormyrops kingsleyae]|uniref:Sulfotransferase n=2 Tax=Paramormyrops kingsleyae TaxID=1676925 RepID=A0A3B3QBA1_9TELE|nr:carbohydrate sulfotransferase 6-like isoform X2 [Paramormyrops kingsleyae]XP_023675566.1 carbohydrate sulfotransferase 6-like isoform X2 [Paramormyrops kingsleyae]